MSDRYLNRELSWLDFNDRVLALASEAETPLLERVRFLGLAARNLDEFFQVRVAGLMEQVAAGVVDTPPDGLTPRETLSQIRAAVEDHIAARAKTFSGDLRPALAVEGIRFLAWDELNRTEREALSERFHDLVFPVLTPLAVDPSHPFPYISDLSLNLAVFVRHPGSGTVRFAGVKVPPILPRFMSVGDEQGFVALEDVIAAHLGDLFPGMEIVEHHPFRVTRNADLTVEEDEAEDLLAAIQTELTRRRFGRVVRLEVEPGITTDVLNILLRELNLKPESVFAAPGPLDLAGLLDVTMADRHDLRYPAWGPKALPELAAVDGVAPDLFRVIRSGDVLVHHPYDAFSASVVELLTQATADPMVLAIKQTLYRTSSDSPIVRALITAAEAGKQVVALVELRARFDEEKNIAWARALEEAGVHVVYGVVGLKTHTKTTLIVRREGEGIRRYAHVGSGNYNEATADQYEDVGLMTADRKIGADLSDLFNFMTGYGEQGRYRRLVVAPGKLRKRLLKRIRREAVAGDGHIVMKMNALVDKEMIDELYAASEAGTRVDLVVRGICCLRPGIEGMSSNIAVRSIVGRYLEHSRLFRFGSQKRGYGYFIGSADLMPRNLDHRIEAMAPIRSPAHRERLEEIIEVLLAPDTKAWVLAGDGVWSPIGSVDSQEVFQRMAGERSGGVAVG